MRKIFKPALWLLAFAAAGCVYSHPAPEDAEEELAAAYGQSGLAEVPDDVLAELNPDSPPDEKYLAGDADRISVAAVNVPAAEFFAGVAGQASVPVAVHPGVAGNITLTLENATPDEVFDAVYRMYGYSAEKKDGVYYVYPAGMRTETVVVGYLSMVRDAETRLAVVNNTVADDEDGGDSSSWSDGGSSGDSGTRDSSGTRVTTSAKSDFWKDLQETLEAIVGEEDGRMVKVNPHASSVTVRGMPEDIRNVRDYLDGIGGSLRRQVVIEAKILEVTLNENYAQGIDWSAVTGHTFTFGTAVPFNGGTSDSVIGVIGGGGSFSAASSHFNALVEFLKTQGDVTALSNPRITALNNQKAVMKVGTDSYFLTDISVDTSASTTTSSNYITSDVEFKPFFSGVSLDVLPQIGDDGEILMHIHPAVINVSQENKEVNLGGGQASMDLPLASSEVRETDTVVRVKSGDIILIGGLMRTETGELVSRVPLLGDIPYLGELFTNRNNYASKKELVILLRPVVADGDAMKGEIGRSLDLLRKWYPPKDGGGAGDGF